MEDRIPKCVKAPSEKLDAGLFGEIEGLVCSYWDCVDLFFARFSGIRSMCLVQKKNKVRDIIRAEQKSLAGSQAVRTDGRRTLMGQFCFQDRHWVMALSDACACIDSAWSSLAGVVRERLRDNGGISTEERQYCGYILSARPYWQAVLLGAPFPAKQPKRFRELREAVDAGRFPFLHSLLRRLTRKNKAAIPKSRQRRSMALDQEMYTIKEKEGACYIEFASRERGKRFRVKLRCAYPWKKKGDIRLVIDRAARTVTVHKLIYAKKRPAVEGSGELGADKGYHTLLSCSDGKEYGIAAGPMLTAETERINRRNTCRNQTVQKKKALDQKAAGLQADRTLPQAERDRAVAAIRKKSANLEKNNTGTRKYDREHHRAQEQIRSLVNHCIYQMVQESRPSVLVKEHLSSIKRGDPGKGRGYNRMMSAWIPGFLDERLEYILALYRGATADINPAYTSKFCPDCGAPITREGAHHEVSVCPNCGKGNANTGAARNILARHHDPEITLYTPYKKVKEILERRYLESHPAPAMA